MDLAALNIAKLRSLLSGCASSGLFAVDVESLTFDSLLDGASAIASSPEGLSRNLGFVLLGDNSHRKLGAAVLWASKRNATELYVLAEHHASALAERAANREMPIRIIKVKDTQCVFAKPAGFGSTYTPQSNSEFDAYALDLVATRAEACGADMFVERGRVGLEILGLEVAVYDQEDKTLHVGVGLNDRLARFEGVAEAYEQDDLERTVAFVREHRFPGSLSTHPVATLARQRWLRSAAIADPSLVSAKSVIPINPLEPPIGLNDTACVAAVIEPVSGDPYVGVFANTTDVDAPLVAAVIAGHVSEETDASEHARVFTTGSTDFLERVAKLTDRKMKVTAVPSPWGAA